MISLIEKELKKACNRKIIKTYKTEALPGINKIVHKKQLQDELDSIQSNNWLFIFIFNSNL